MSPRTVPATCLAVRELLVEHALGALPTGEAGAVERHLEWCAACRKESRDLQDAAAIIGYALPPAAPSAGLEDRVVRSIRAAAGRRSSGRRARSAIASLLAAAIAVAGMGWGAVMAGRAERFERAAREAQERQGKIAAGLRDLLETAPFAGREDETRVVQLAPASSHRVAGGAVVLLVSPRRLDLAVVLLSGLDPSAREAFPYRVSLVGARGRSLVVGRIGEDDVGRDGSAEEASEFAEDLAAFTDVVVQDASGTAVLRGSIRAAPEPAV